MWEDVITRLSTRGMVRRETERQRTMSRSSQLIGDVRFIGYMLLFQNYVSISE
jgi:hypothetical protein